MVVLVILAVLATAILPSVIGKSERARQTKAKTDVAMIESLLDQFYLDMGQYPTTDEGMRVLYYPPDEDSDKWRGPYSKKPIGKDPWGNPYGYRSPGEVTSLEYEVFSYGKDGEEGGEGDDADITSWEDVEFEE